MAFVELDVQSPTYKQSPTYEARTTLGVDTEGLGAFVEELQNRKMGIPGRLSGQYGTLLDAFAEHTRTGEYPTGRARDGSYTFSEVAEVSMPNSEQDGPQDGLDVSTGVMVMEDTAAEDSAQADFKGLPGSRANNPLASAPAVRKSMASTATNRDILPGGEVVEDEEGWSYQRLPNGSVQIVTAPESNKTSVGMILTDKSTGDNKTYYNAISEYVSSKLDNPAAEDEPEEIQQYREGKITPEYRDSLLAAQSEQNPNAIQQMTDVEPVETPMASDKDVAKAGRAMGRRRKVQKAKDIAQRLIDRNVGGMGESF